MKFFQASETAQRHVTEIVERDVREMNTSLQGLKEIVYEKDYYIFFFGRVRHFLIRISSL